jgi:hypothetical protein
VRDKLFCRVVGLFAAGTQLTIGWGSCLRVDVEINTFLERNWHLRSRYGIYNRASDAN